MTPNPSLCEIAQTFSQAQDLEIAKELNSKLVDICRRAIEQASEAPPAIRDWRDMETARKVLAAASGTDVQKPTLNLIFPPSLEGQASEAPRYLRISDNFAAKQAGSQAPALAPVFDALPAIACDAAAAHSRVVMEATGRGAEGRMGA